MLHARCEVWSLDVRGPDKLNLCLLCVVGRDLRDQFFSFETETPESHEI